MSAAEDGGQAQNDNLNTYLTHIERMNAANKYTVPNQKNRGKRIVIRKIAREVGIEYVYDDNGNPIKFEEWEYQNKYINFKAYQWPKGVQTLDF